MKYMESSQTFITSTAIAKPNNLMNEPFRCSYELSDSALELTPQSQVEEIPYGYIGSLDIFVHQARDIQNICIYHKQDVYAKLCLTSDPESVISTKIINGGGRNPVFGDNLQLNVRTIDSSLKCEIWMLSRARNYLKDQLLGFALVPLSEVVIGRGKLAQEFSLSSTDLFHSPSGFVQLSLSYNGSSPEVMVITAPESTKDAALPDLVVDNDSISCDYVMIEFPDMKVVDENKMMASEYFGIPCANLNLQNIEGLISPGCDDYLDNDAGVVVVDSFSTNNNHNSADVQRNDTSLSNVSPVVSSAAGSAASQAISEPSGTTESPTQKSKNTDIADGDTGSSAGEPEKDYAPLIIKVNIEPEQPVVQQEIVDMYMKSMQQFTESLAKMKLPVDIENSSSGESGNANLDKKLQASKNTGGKVFYGSRAFF